MLLRVCFPLIGSPSMVRPSKVPPSTSYKVGAAEIRSDAWRAAAAAPTLVASAGRRKMPSPKLLDDRISPLGGAWLGKGAVNL